MINHFRNFLIVKTVKDSRELIICTDDEYGRIKLNSGKFSLPAVIHALDLFQDTLVKIKGGANSRIEMEMSFIKLCEPKLDESSDSVLERIAQLENVVNNRSFASAPQTSQPVKENVKTTDSAVSDIKNVQPTVDENKTAETHTSASENTAVTPEKQIPQQEPQNVSAQSQGSFSPEQQEFSQWADFMEEIYKKDIALYGVLNGSSGYTRGEYFLIESKNNALRDFIKIPTHSKAIKCALYNLTGNHYKLGLFKHKTEESKKRDPLEDLILKAQGNTDIDVN